MLKFWKRIAEQRSWPTWSTSQTVAEFSDMFAEGITTASTMTVTPGTALTVPAVFSCCQVLSQDVARTPIKLRRKVAEDTYVDAVEHDLFEILNALPNPETTASEFKFAMMRNLLAFGKAYAQIVRVDGRVTALWALDPCRMRVDRDDARRKRWTYTAGGQSHVWTFDASQPPIFELSYDTPIYRCRELVGVALALQTFTAKFFANGGRLNGVLKAQGAVKQDTLDRLRTFWNDTFAKPGNAHKIAILDSGLEYQPFQPDNERSQLTETQHAINAMIAGAFRVPTWKIGDLTKANYSNMESGELAYVTSTLDPFYQSWEEAIRRDLLTTRQYGSYTVMFDRNALVRNDVRSLHDALARGIQSGIYSQNDARKALGLNPIPDGDRYLVNSALVPAANAGEPNAA